VCRPMLFWMFLVIFLIKEKVGFSFEYYIILYADEDSVVRKYSDEISISHSSCLNMSH
jgi:hypothetical protein